MLRKISVIGLGYVGLPIAVAFGKHGAVIGFDTSAARIKSLNSGFDETCEVSPEELDSSQITFSSDPHILESADFHIVTVPTPINSSKEPDLGPLKLAAELVGEVIKVGDIVVFESTVYPGTTEDICIPILEEISGLRSGADFFVGYAPERINPGDQEHSFTKVKKVVSAQDEQTRSIIADVYSSVVTAGVYLAPSIRVAEAAKVIENSQRDINIAFVNELAMLFEKMEISTKEVLDTAATKWNFMEFLPGLVGGHCIGVDPYYLTYKAESLGYHPEVLLAGRKINDGMGRFVAQKTIKLMIGAGHNIKNSSVIVLGLTFKENCKDIRNSKVYDIIDELKSFGVSVQVHDPICSVEEAKSIYGVDLIDEQSLKEATALILAVPHHEYIAWSETAYREILVRGGVFVDIKSCFHQNFKNDDSIIYWGL